MSTNELNNLNVNVNNKLLEKFKKQFPIETFIVKPETVEFIFELTKILKLYPEKDYKTILPKIASCIDIDIKNGTLNKKSREKVKLCLKK